VAVGDMDGDGDLDVVVANFGEQNKVYWNDGDAGFDWATPAHDFGTGKDDTAGLAVGDLDGDGDLDIVLGNAVELNTVYLNGSRTAQRLANSLPSLTVSRPGSTENADFHSTPEILDSRYIRVPYSLSDPEGGPVERIVAKYSPDGGGRWYSAAAYGVLGLLTCGPARHTSSILVAETIPAGEESFYDLMVPESPPSTDVNAWVSLLHPDSSELDIALISPEGIWVTLFKGEDVGGPGDGLINTTFDDEAPGDLGTGAPPFSGRFRPVDELGWVYGQSMELWQLHIANNGGDDGTLLSWGVHLQSGDCSYHYWWDTFQSGFFGQSDDVVFRIEAYPGLQPYAGTASGPHQWPYVAAQTFPFRVRGTQIRVISGTVPAPEAMVYRILAGQDHGGTPYADSAGEPIRTGPQGYLHGRGELNQGDRLVALLPIDEAVAVLEEGFEGLTFPPARDGGSYPHLVSGDLRPAQRRSLRLSQVLSTRRRCILVGQSPGSCAARCAVDLLAAGRLAGVVSVSRCTGHHRRRPGPHRRQLR
jgi:subtilisin-like proprotein convertase family protein